MNINEKYNSLLREIHDYCVLDQIENLLNWDFETYMPSKGVKQRAKQLAMIANLKHKHITNPMIGKIVKAIKNDSGFSNLEKIKKRNIILIERKYNRESRIPKDLIKNFAKQRPISLNAWKQAKKEKNYQIFEPELKKTIELIKTKAEYIDPNKDPFDVLIEEFEPGMTSEILSELFHNLRKGLIPLIAKCSSSPNQPDSSLIFRNCPIPIQRKLSKDIAKLFCYDFKKGRIDETEHPFTTGYYDDVRITTRYNENDFSTSFFSVLHEAGHGIYEQNLSEDYKYQFVGKSASNGIHESQSRFIENLIGRSRNFWEFYLPKFKKLTDDVFADIELDPFIHAINWVRPSKIRVDADEVTYSIHVMIRFEIEQAILKGDLTTEQLPTIWNKKYKDYLNVNIENDSEGLLQDIHWAYGIFGYFPSYALGNIYNAQLLVKLSKELSDYKELIRKGDIRAVIDWLVKNVYKLSNEYDPLPLIEKVTGEKLTTKYFLDYLEEKYSELYHFAV